MREEGAQRGTGSWGDQTRKCPSLQMPMYRDRTMTKKTGPSILHTWHKKCFQEVRFGPGEKGYWNRQRKLLINGHQVSTIWWNGILKIKMTLSCRRNKLAFSSFMKFVQRIISTIPTNYIYYTNKALAGPFTLF